MNPEIIISNQANAGSDLHKRLLIKTIDLLHQTNNFVVSTETDFDLIAYKVDSRKCLTLSLAPE